MFLFALTSSILHDVRSDAIMMSIKPSTKIGKSMAPGSGVKALGRGQYGHEVKMC